MVAAKLHYSFDRCRDTFSRLLIRYPIFRNLGWTASRKYWFALLFIAIFSAKVLHVYSHLSSLPLPQLLVWGPTFFVQDVLCIFVCWGLCRNFHNKWVRISAALVAVPASIAISFMSAANASFYITTGAEIHWRQAHSFHRDFASVKTLLAGLTGVLIIEAVFLIVSWFTATYLYNGVREVLRALSSCVGFAFRCCRRKSTPLPDPEIYEQVAVDDFDDKSDSDSVFLLGEPTKPVENNTRSTLLKRAVILFAATYVAFLGCIRPSDSAYWFLSQTLVVTPFGGSRPHGGHALVDIPGALGEYSWLGNRTALDIPPKFDWLPVEELPGFRDWYANKNSKEPYLHYNPKQDPLHVSNLEGEVIEPYRKALHDGSVKIKHVFLIKLESTREDVFPLRKDSFMHDRLKSSFNGKVPDEVEQRYANLTPTAERLTGTPSGWNGNNVKPYGGIHATNSHTAGTFTLKSLTGSICGLSPLVVDFNKEYLHHIYQPCMPHIFDAISAQYNGTDKTKETNRTDDFTSWPWRTAFMQSITDLYDNQNFLTPVLGFKDSINVDTIMEDRAKNPKSGTEEVNFWGYPDDELRDYFRDALNKAEEDKERLFITHLTGITHYPWNMPHDEFEEMAGSTWLPFNKKLGRYLNTLNYIDKWLAETLQILEETGAANETLLVITGDHGITLPEDGGVTPYDNPHISNFHVPLVFAHPQLPAIEIDSPVTSMQILPTILDLLQETSSVDEKGMRVIKDLLPMYEGQSIIRPLVPEANGKQDWQFTVMNTGGTWVSLRSAAKPYRLVIPLVPDVEWRFSNVETDPKERSYLMSFDLLALIDQAKRRYGEDAYQWINDAAHVAQWWLNDNWRRYEYTP
ncbi:hypothetical protein AWENTII_006272 [Aspergillus wentii]